MKLRLKGKRYNVAANTKIYALQYIFQLPPIDSIAKQLHLQLDFYGKFYNLVWVSQWDDKFICQVNQEHFQWTQDEGMILIFR